MNVYFCFSVRHPVRTLESGEPSPAPTVAPATSVGRARLRRDGADAEAGLEPGRRTQAGVQQPRRLRRHRPDEQRLGVGSVGVAENRRVVAAAASDRCFDRQHAAPGSVVGLR